ncbi:Xre family transcriptional regulator [Geothermobacter ehrlichii]|uniref:Xre family transcriptional regulator n=1 Tax=Geothermobacter ehrlichii TaxID=213224 RepID=A0A5D3WKB8_9BACT|nr:helix-turn-helix domain-containing protein [Geothermobacter ehrlichii]TYO99402.1 Xre family transcriptional regulator [Geothermobacter ehrlichii]
MIRKVISPESLGAALREARRQQGLSQTEAGRPVGLDQPTVSRVEQGSPGTRLDTLFRLLAALDLELVLQPRQPAANSSEEDSW